MFSLTRDFDPIESFATFALRCSLSRQEVSREHGVEQRHVPQGARDAPGDTSTNTQYNFERDNVRGLQKPVVHVETAPRAHPPERGLLQPDAREHNPRSAARQAGGDGPVVREPHGRHRTESPHEKQRQVRGGNEFVRVRPHLFSFHRFTQNLSMFRRDINDSLKGPNVNTSSVNDMMTS